MLSQCMGVYSSFVDPWKEHNEPLSLFYKNNNGLANGKMLQCRQERAYYLAYTPQGVSLLEGTDSFRPDVIGVLEVHKEPISRDLGNCHYIPLRRFRISPGTRAKEVRAKLDIVNDQVFFIPGEEITLVQGNETLTFKVQKA